MKKFIKLMILGVSIIMFSGCGTHVMKYDSKSDMSLNQATEIIDRLIMEQHPAWRPDFVEINDRYVLQGYGTVTQGRRKAAVLGVTRASGNRVYFESTDRAVLYSWKRKFKQWYVVSLVGKNRQHMLRTRHIDEAEQMVDALQVVLNSYKTGNL